MALPALRDNLDGVAEVIASEYKKRDDGKFVLDVTAVADGENGNLELAPVSKLKAALESERTQTKKLAAIAKKFENIDPEKATAALKKVEEIANWKPETEVESRIKLIKDELVGAHGKEKTELQSKQAKLEAQLKKVLVTNVAVTAIQKAGGSVKLLLPVVEQHIRMRENSDSDNPYIVDVVNEKGDVRVGDGSGSPMSIDQLVEEFKSIDEYAGAFSASGAQGTGAASSGNGTQKTSNNSASSRKVVQRGTIITGMSVEDVASGKVTVA